MAHPIIQRVVDAKGNSLLADQLIRDYLPFIRSEISKLSPGGSHGDELSIAMIAFHEAIESYRPDRGAFLPYAAVVIRNRLIDFFRSESRHQNLSLSTPLEGENLTLEDTLVDPNDPVGEMEMAMDTKAEIEEFSKQLQRFGLTLSDIADHTPKQECTLDAVHDVIRFIRAHPHTIQELFRTKKLPIKAIAQGTGVHKKVIERHRKYVIAMMIVFSNGYDILRDHIGMIFHREGGVGL